MHRSLTLALLGVMLACNPALANNRGEASPGRPQAATVRQPAPQHHASLGAATPGAMQQGVARRVLPVQGSARGKPAASRGWRAASSTASCGRGAARCRAQPVGWSVGGWASGLSPAANTQANGCPAGTMATLARGHDDVVRCMPI